jgi:hypothetical protein
MNFASDMALSGNCLRTCLSTVIRGMFKSLAKTMNSLLMLRWLISAALFSFS